MKIYYYLKKGWVPRQLSYVSVSIPSAGGNSCFGGGGYEAVEKEEREERLCL